MIFSEDLAVLNASKFNLTKNLVIWDGEIESELFDHLASFDQKVLDKMSSELKLAYSKVSKEITYK